MTKIYESPDRGQTVYEREIGAPINTRVEIKRPYTNGKGIEGNTEMEIARRVSKTWSMGQD
tara:strand:- start:1253 stop:1435 length:183 start_codon:yes stop_codon:yes gene_type:complete